MAKEIELYGGKGITILDDEDYEPIMRFSQRWYIHDRGYACCHTKRIHKRMHRLILELHGNNLQGHQVDHKDGNRLNNQKFNLKICSNEQNSRNSNIRIDNTSGYKGVYWYQQEGKWAAQIHLLDKHYSLGIYSSKIEAAQAYNVASEILFAEFSKPNPVPEASPEIKQRVIRAINGLKTYSSNKSGYTGVDYRRDRNKWRARIKLDNKEILLGHFSTKEEAIVAREKAEQKFITTPKFLL